ncbi:MAG: cation transporter [Bacteroidota bacterium]
MKNNKSIVSVIFFFIFMIGMFAFSFAQNQKKGISEFKLKVYFNDVKAKALIEKEIIKTIGVKTVSADINTKIVTFTFDSNTTDRLKINNAIEKLGFETDITKREIKAKKTCTDAEQKKAVPAK